MYKLFLCLRYLRKRRIAFFSIAAVWLCTAMVLIVVSVMGGFLQMVRDRSRGMLGDLIMENQTLQGFPFYAEFIELIKNDPQLKDRIYEATPVIISYGVIRFPSDQITKPAQIVGIKLEETYRVNDFKKGLFYEKHYPGTTTFEQRGMPLYGQDGKGNYILPPELETARRKWEATATKEEIAEAKGSKHTEKEYTGPGFYLWQPLGGPVEPGYVEPELPGAILGTDLVARRQRDGTYERDYNRGYPISLTFVPFNTSGQPQTATGMPSRQFRYVDDCRTGVFDIDSMSVYVDFELLQHILEMDRVEPTEGSGGEAIPARTTQVQIKLAEGADPLETRALLQARWEPFFNKRITTVRVPELLRRVEIKTWEEKQAKYIAAVEKEKYLVTTLFGVISMVAVFLVACIFYMIVQQKTRDIGIIKSVGATAVGVAQIFLAYGVAVGIVGGGMGTITGTYFVKYINEFQDLLRRINPGLEVWNPEVYAFDRIPNQVEMTDALAIYAVAIVVSVIGSLIAAIQASRIWPVEALRYE